MPSPSPRLGLVIDLRDGSGTMWALAHAVLAAVQGLAYDHEIPPDGRVGRFQLAINPREGADSGRLLAVLGRAQLADRVTTLASITPSRVDAVWGQVILRGTVPPGQASGLYRWLLLKEVWDKYLAPTTPAPTLVVLDCPSDREIWQVATLLDRHPARSDFFVNAPGRPLQMIPHAKSSDDRFHFFFRRIFPWIDIDLNATNELKRGREPSDSSSPDGLSSFIEVLAERRLAATDGDFDFRPSAAQAVRDAFASELSGRQSLTALLFLAAADSLAESRALGDEEARRWAHRTARVQTGGRRSRSVGLKQGRSWVAALGPDVWVRTLREGNAAVLKRVNGIGPVTAQRLIEELRPVATLSAPTADARNRPLDLSRTLGRHVRQIDHVARALLHLLDNIAAHAPADSAGLLQVRIVDDDPAHMEEWEEFRDSWNTGCPTHSPVIQEYGTYLVATVADYSPQATDLAETFRRHHGYDRGAGNPPFEQPPATDDLSRFEHLRPADFFETAWREEVRPAWQRYFGGEFPDHIGLHTGLAAFADQVRRLGGVFHVKSRSADPQSRTSGEGQIFDSRGQAFRGADEDDLPGTTYTVIFPLHGVSQGESARDVSERGPIDHWAPYLTRSAARELPIDLVSSGDPRDRAGLINAVADHLGDALRSALPDELLQVDAMALEQRWPRRPATETAEILAKAVQIAARQALCRKPTPDGLPSLIVDNASSAFFDEFLATTRVITERASRSNNYAVEPDDFRCIIIAGNEKSSTATPASDPGPRHPHWSGAILVRDNFAVSVGLTRLWWRRRGLAAADNDVWPIGSDCGPISPDPDLPDHDLPPYELLCAYPDRANPSGGASVPFVHYAAEVLERDILDPGLGCRIDRAHMRLGSTIHTDRFYEAELLFNNEVFARRFAFLLVRDLVQRTPNPQALSRVTFYGYSAYSQFLLLQACSLLDDYLDKAIGLGERDHPDYALYERLAIAGGAPASRIRFVPDEPSRRFASLIDHETGHDRRSTRALFAGRAGTEAEQRPLRRRYYCGDGGHPARKIVTVVPLGSTLKTTLKMRSEFVHEVFDREQDEERGFFSNFYTIISLGSKGPRNSLNPFWEKRENRPHELWPRGSADVEPVRFFLETEQPFLYPYPLTWRQGPAGDGQRTEEECRRCYPKDYRNEWPLIEVNTDSSIPTQAIDLPSATPKPPGGIDWSTIQDLEERLDPLRDCVTYGHTVRDEHHFEFYIDTAQVVDQNEGKIREWLEDIAGESATNQPQSGFDVLVSPQHFTNAKFVELVNECVFSSQALIVRTEVSKEFRSNFRARFSLIASLLRDQSAAIRFHFVDDQAITGATVERARDLMMSVVRDSDRDPSRITFFKHFFFVLDRLSLDSQSHLVGCPDSLRPNTDRFHSFVHVAISSLRTRGDSCLRCQRLSTIHDIVPQTATRKMRDCFESLDERHQPRPLHDRTPDSSDQSRGWRRFACAHIAQRMLEGDLAADLSPDPEQDWSPQVGQRIVGLLETDFSGRSADGEPEMARQYFLAYLNALARPPLATHGTVRPTILRLLVSILEAVITRQLEQTATTGAESPPAAAPLENPAKRPRHHQPARAADPVNPSFVPLPEAPPAVAALEAGLPKEFRRLAPILSSFLPASSTDSSAALFDLVRLCLSRLADLRSTYVYRPEVIARRHELADRLGWHGQVTPGSADGTRWYHGGQFDDFDLRLIKTVLTGTSDTSDSAWLDRAILDDERSPAHKALVELLEARRQGHQDPVDGAFWEDVLMETNRVHWEAVSHMQRLLRDALPADLRAFQAFVAWSRGNVSQPPPPPLDRAVERLKRILSSSGPLEDYDDYVLVNWRQRLESTSLKDWAGDSGSPSFMPAVRAVLRPVVLLHYALTMFPRPRPGAGSGVGFTQLDHAGRVDAMARYHLLTHLIHETLSAKDTSIVLAGYPPEDQWKVDVARQRGIRSDEEWNEDRDLATLSWPRPGHLAFYSAQFLSPSSQSDPADQQNLAERPVEEPSEDIVEAVRAYISNDRERGWRLRHRCDHGYDDWELVWEAGHFDDAELDGVPMLVLVVAHFDNPWTVADYAKLRDVLMLRHTLRQHAFDLDSNHFVRDLASEVRLRLGGQSARIFNHASQPRREEMRKTVADHSVAPEPSAASLALARGAFFDVDTNESVSRLYQRFALTPSSRQAQRERSLGVGQLSVHRRVGLTSILTEPDGNFYHADIEVRAMTADVAAALASPCDWPRPHTGDQATTHDPDGSVVVTAQADDHDEWIPAQTDHSGGWRWGGVQLLRESDVELSLNSLVDVIVANVGESPKQAHYTEQTDDGIRQFVVWVGLTATGVLHVVNMLNPAAAASTFTAHVEQANAFLNGARHPDLLSQDTHLQGG